MKKILTAITLFCLIAALCATSAFAYSEDVPTGGSNAEGETFGEINDANMAVSQSEEAYSDTSNDTATDGNSDEEGGGNAFKEIYEFVISNSDKLFAMLAFISSLLVGFAYKKGLIPLVKTALGALGNGVALLKEEAKQRGEEANLALSNAENKLSKAEENIALVAEKLTALEEELTKSREGAMKDKELRLILGSQIDLLYEIFMSSSLPDYQKDAIGERVAEMKRALVKETEIK